jgi:hypothetical protein
MTFQRNSELKNSVFVRPITYNQDVLAYDTVIRERIPTINKYINIRPVSRIHTGKRVAVNKWTDDVI